jgi:hypothetical protein
VRFCVGDAMIKPNGPSRVTTAIARRTPKMLCTSDLLCRPHASTDRPPAT